MPCVMSLLTKFYTSWWQKIRSKAKKSCSSFKNVLTHWLCEWYSTSNTWCCRPGGGGRNCHSGLGVFLGCSVVFSLPRCNPPLFLWESSWEGGRRVFLVFFHLIFLREKREVFPTYSPNKRASTRVHTRNVGVTVLAVSGYMVKNTKAWLPIFLSGLLSPLRWCFIAAKTSKESRR